MKFEIINNMLEAQLQNLLEETGFTEKEANVYLALLELGEANVTQIAEKSELKRSIVYVILESLIKRGYASEIPGAKVNHYSSVDPIKILQHLQGLTTNFKQMLPVFRGLYNKPVYKPKIHYFEGKQGVLSVYRQINPIKGSLFFTSIHRIAKHIPEEIESWIQGIRNEKIIPNAKHILPNTKEDLRFGKKIHGFNKNQVRILPKIKEIDMDLSIFDNKVALTSLEKKHLFIVVIESEALYKSMKIMFDLAWKSAKTIKLAEK